jgi:hypothetical protein
MSDASFLGNLFTRCGAVEPAGIADWIDGMYDGFDAYQGLFPGAELTNIDLDRAVFVFDLTLERVVLACALSKPPSAARDTSRIRGFPGVQALVDHHLGAAAFKADKGHFIGHVSGGRLDVNLFAQRRELNRGWSPEGKVFRALEKHVASKPGTFFFHQVFYDDETPIPMKLRFGIIDETTSWRVEEFRNK